MSHEVALETMMEMCREAFGDNAGGFTCEEANTIANAYMACMRFDDAEEFIRLHGEGDDYEGDSHGTVSGQYYQLALLAEENGLVSIAAKWYEKSENAEDAEQ